MPVLAERTKVRSNSGSEISTTEWGIRGSGYEDYQSGGQFPIDANAYAIASGSIKINTLSYIPQLSLKAKFILQKLVGFQKLPENWDSNFASAPSHMAISAAIEFTQQADEFELPFYFTAPGPNGEIAIEFKREELAAEVYFNEDNSQELIIYDGRNQIYEGPLNMFKLVEHFTPIV